MLLYKWDWRLKRHQCLHQGVGHCLTQSFQAPVVELCQCVVYLHKQSVKLLMCKCSHDGETWKEKWSSTCMTVSQFENHRIIDDCVTLLSGQCTNPGQFSNISCFQSCTEPQEVSQNVWQGLDVRNPKKSVVPDNLWRVSCQFPC